MALTIDSYDQVSVIINFTESFDNYEFAINGAFTAPSESSNTTYLFKGLFPGTEYRISAYNFNGVEPTTEAYFQIFTTQAGVNVPTNPVLSNPQVSSNQILFQILDPDTFTTDNISINDGFASNEITKSILNQIFIIGNLAPSTTYSIQYFDGEFYIASYILTTSSVDPPPPEPETTTSTGLSDGARIGIIFGSVFAFFLLYYMFYL
jgi:hypothetical protein